MYRALRHMFPCLLLCGAATEVATAAPDPNQVWESIQQQRELASSYAPPVPVHLAYTVEWHWSISEAELADMRVRIRNKPDHPDRQRVLQVEQYNREGPAKKRVRLWLTPDGRGRLSADHSQGFYPYIDRAIGHQGAWTLTSDNLTVTRADGVGSPPERNASSGAKNEFAEFQSLFWGPLSAQPGVEFVRRDLKLDGNTWTVSTRLASKATLIVQGVWDQSTSTARAMNVRLVPDDGSALDGSQGSATEWRWFATMNQAFPTVVQDELHGIGRFRVLLLESVAPMDLAEMDRLTALPSESAPDPTRGDLTFTSVLDFRDKSSNSSAENGISFDADPASQGADFARTKWLRWSALAAAIAIAVWIVARRLGIHGAS